MDNNECSLDNIWGALHGFQDDKAMSDFLEASSKVVEGKSPESSLDLADYFNINEIKDIDTLTDSVRAVGEHIKKYTPTTDAELQEKAFSFLESHLENQYDISGPDKKSLVSKLVSSGDSVAASARLAVAGTQMKDALTNQIINLGKQGVFADPEAIAKLEKLRATFKEVFLADKYLGSNQGLALRARQTPGELPDNALLPLLDDSLSIPEVVDLITKVSNREAIKKSLWGTVNKGIGLWTNNILSGTTLPIAATSNVAQTLLMPLEEAIGGALLTRTGRARVQGTLGGLLQFTKDATQVASDAFNYGHQTQQYLNENIIGKVDPIIPQTTAGEISGANFADSMWQGFGNTMGIPGYLPSLENMFSMPGRLLTTTDTFFKELNQRARLAGLINGKLMDANGKINPEDYNKMWKEVIEDPDHLMWKEAEAYGHDVAFTAPVDVPNPTFIQGLAKGVQGFKESKNPYLATLGHFIAPFVVAPANIVENVKGHIPGIGLAGKEGANLLKGGQYTNQAAGKQMAGLLMMGAAYGLVQQGLLTGNGPANPEQQQVLKDLGWSPNSIKIGDNWVSLNRFSPIADYLSFFADMVTYSEHIQDWEMEKMASSVSASFVNKISNMKMLSGLADFYGVFNKLGHGQDPKLDSATGRFLSGFTPFSGALNVIGANDDEYMREARGIWENIQKRIPGFRDGLSTKFNLLGEPVIEQEGFGFTKKDPSHPVNKELIFLMNNGGTFTPMSPKDDSGVDFRDFKNPQGLDLYTSINQELSTIGSTPLKEKLLEVINSDAYKNIPMYQPNSKDLDPQSIISKAAILQSVIRDYRKSAKEKLTSDVRFKNSEGKSAFQMIHYDNVGNNARFLDELNSMKSNIDSKAAEMEEEEDSDSTTQILNPFDDTEGAP